VRLKTKWMSTLPCFHRLTIELIENSTFYAIAFGSCFNSDSIPPYLTCLRQVKSQNAVSSIPSESCPGKPHRKGVLADWFDRWGRGRLHLYVLACE
jgi:hypothetical protein